MAETNELSETEVVKNRLQDAKTEKSSPDNFVSFWKSIFSNDSKSFSGNRRTKESDAEFTCAALPVPHLSPVGHSVISRCSKILQIPPEELQHNFDLELPDKAGQPSNYARNFLEYCSYQAIHFSCLRADYLSDKDFRTLMFDMMLAWESSGVENDFLVNETAPSDSESEDSSSLFFSNSTRMAVQVDDKKTVGRDAFARIAPACTIVADVITVHNLFDVLTSSSGHRLHFLMHEKYLRSLERVVKAVRNGAGTQFLGNISLAEEEIILDLDGTVPTQPVLQHVGISAWPGRLTLTNYALYFESGVGLYDKAVKYDLATDTKQVIKPELTGPLGARLFDKAVMYKSTCIMEPVYFEFPEFRGSSRRDYWLDISVEILRSHRFVRKYNLKERQKGEALARAILGIFRYRAVREAFHLFSSSYKTLLCYNLAESLPGGHVILDTLSNHFAGMNSSTVVPVSGSPSTKKPVKSPVSLLTLRRLGIMSCKEVDMDVELKFQSGDVCVGVINALEAAVKQSELDTGRAKAAQATVDQVKVEGVDTNLALMKDLLSPLIYSYDQLQRLVSWDEPWKSSAALILISYTIFREWIKYAVPFVLVLFAAAMLWNRYTKKWKVLEAFKIKLPPTKNAVEQLISLQEAIAQFEGLIQSANIILLKLRAIIFAVSPQATDEVTMCLLAIAATLVIVPFKYVLMLAFAEWFTRRISIRREDSERFERRIREWWIRIPAAPVRLIKVDDKKRK